MTEKPAPVVPTVTVRAGIPLPKTGKGRPPRPQNPVLLAMQPGESFVVSGTAAKEMANDLVAVKKARTDVRFTTRNMSGKADPATFEAYPANSLGVWCLALPVKESGGDQ